MHLGTGRIQTHHLVGRLFLLVRPFHMSPAALTISAQDSPGCSTEQTHIAIARSATTSALHNGDLTNQLPYQAQHGAIANIAINANACAQAADQL